MTWYQDGPAIYRDVDVCRLMRGRYWDCGDDENRCGAPTLPWWKGDCVRPWGRPWCEIWDDYRPDEVWNTCQYESLFRKDYLGNRNCHAPPTIPGREVVYAEDRAS